MPEQGADRGAPGCSSLCRLCCTRHEPIFIAHSHASKRAAWRNPELSPVVDVWKIRLEGVRIGSDATHSPGPMRHWLTRRWIPNSQHVVSPRPMALSGTTPGSKNTSRQYPLSIIDIAFMGKCRVRMCVVTGHAVPSHTS